MADLIKMVDEELPPLLFLSGSGDSPGPYMLAFFPNKEVTNIHRFLY